MSQWWGSAGGCSPSEKNELLPAPGGDERVYVECVSVWVSGCGRHRLISLPESGCFVLRACGVQKTWPTTRRTLTVLHCSSSSVGLDEYPVCATHSVLQSISPSLYPHSLPSREEREPLRPFCTTVAYHTSFPHLLATHTAALTASLRNPVACDEKEKKTRAWLVVSSFQERLLSLSSCSLDSVESIHKSFRHHDLFFSRLMERIRGKEFRNQAF